MKQFKQDILDENSSEKNLSKTQLLSLKILSLERKLPVNIHNAIQIEIDKKGFSEIQIKNFKKEVEDKLKAPNFFFHRHEITLIILLSIILNIFSPIFLFSIYVSVILR